MTVNATATEDFDADIARIATAVAKKRCILFLGAGVHAPPPKGSPIQYPPRHRPPIGSALSRRLASSCNLKAKFPNEDPRALQRVSLFYEIATSRYELVEAVIEEVQTGKQPSPMLRALAELDFPVVITTNYDQLFEAALERAGKTPRIAIYTPNSDVPTEELDDPTVDSPILFKVHGDISRRETIVITDEDYIKFVLRMGNKEPYAPIPLTVLELLTQWPTLFVGYSLLDYNLRLLFRTLRWKLDLANIPPSYSVDYRPDPLIRDVWHDQQRFVTFIVQDVWAFVPKLYARVTGRKLEPEP